MRRPVFIKPSDDRRGEEKYTYKEREYGKRKSRVENRQITEHDESVSERLTRIENMLSEVLERLKSIEGRLSELEKSQSKAETGSGKGKKTALDIIRDQGVIFESDLKNIDNKERFFGYLSKHGVIIIEGSKERVAVTKEFLTNFEKELEKYRSPAEAEEKLREPYRRFYEFLRNSNYLIHDTKKGWVMILGRKNS